MKVVVWESEGQKMVSKMMATEKKKQRPITDSPMATSAAISSTLLAAPEVFL